MKTIAVAGTFDTKGKEFLYVKELIEELGLKTYMINTGVFNSEIEVDVSNKEIAKEAGYDIEDIVSRRDRAMASTAFLNIVFEILFRPATSTMEGIIIMSLVPTY